MTAAGARARPGSAPGVLDRVRRWGWRHPEWWVVAAAAGAWAWMAAIVPAGHGAHGPATGADVRATGLMVAAMMLPMAIPGVRHVASSSLWRRRHRAIAGFAAGYLAVWMLAMAALTGAVGVAAALAGWTAAAVVAMAAAALWELAPVKRRLLRRCGRTVPLAPNGWRADADCARFGAQAGASCVCTCWALMAACVAFAHSLPLMAVLFGVQLAGRYRRHPSPALAALAVLGVCLAAVAARYAGWPCG